MPIARSVEAAPHAYSRIPPFKRLRDLRWAEVKGIVFQGFEEWNTHNATRLGASLAFYSLLSLAPLTLVIVSIVGLAFGHTAAEYQTISQAQELMGPAAAKALSAFLQGSKDTTQGVVATILGFITLLISASGVVIELRDTLNVIWDAPVQNTTGLKVIMSFVKDRLFSFAIVFGIGFLLIVSLVLSAWITAIVNFSVSILPGEGLLLHVANIVISFIALTFLFGAIYKVMPDVHLEWGDVIFGGAVTSLLFSIGKLVLGFYLGRASFASMYGAAASIVVLIAWVYYSAQIFFLGAEFTKAFAERYGSRRFSRREAKPGSGAEGPQTTIAASA